MSADASRVNWRFFTWHPQFLSLCVSWCTTWPQQMLHNMVSSVYVLLDSPLDLINWGFTNIIGLCTSCCKLCMSYLIHHQTSWIVASLISSVKCHHMTLSNASSNVIINLRLNWCNMRPHQMMQILSLWIFCWILQTGQMMLLPLAPLSYVSFDASSDLIKCFFTWHHQFMSNLMHH